MKAGIVCDNYKVERFKKELTQNGFTDFTLSNFVGNTTTIQVITTEEKIPEIRKICKEVEMFFKQAN